MKALVTGGGGFLGGAILRQLLDRGDEVRSFSRGDYPALRELGAETHRGDLADPDQVDRAVQGCDTVFHVAGQPGVWGPYSLYHRTNVLGTQHIIDACRRHGVPRLIFTSSSSVTFDGKDHEGADESQPYPRRFYTHYARTKAAAETAVLKANSDTLSTVALRPHLVWGPGDTQLTPRVIERGRAGKLRIMGQGKNLVDHLYIDNAADAHLLAADRLEPNAPCAGKAYTITNGEPLPMAELLNQLLATANVPPITRRINPHLAYLAGATLELAYWILRRKQEPLMTRFVALQLAKTHTYDITAAQRDLDYHPKVTLKQGMQRLAGYCQQSPPPLPQ